MHKRKILVSTSLGFDTTFYKEMLDRDYSITGFDQNTTSVDSALKALAGYLDAKIPNAGI